LEIGKKSYLEKVFSVYLKIINKPDEKISIKLNIKRTFDYKGLEIPSQKTTTWRDMSSEMLNFKRMLVNNKTKLDNFWSRVE
jgi:hypothetical protein